MSKIVRFGFITNSRLEGVDLEYYSAKVTPHIDYCKIYKCNEATLEEKLTFQK